MVRPLLSASCFLPPASLLPFFLPLLNQKRKEAARKQPLKKNILL